MVYISIGIRWIYICEIFQLNLYLFTILGQPICCTVSSSSYLPQGCFPSQVKTTSIYLKSRRNKFAINPQDKRDTWKMTSYSSLFVWFKQAAGFFSVKRIKEGMGKVISSVILKRTQKRLKEWGRFFGRDRSCLINIALRTNCL